MGLFIAQAHDFLKFALMPRAKAAGRIIETPYPHMPNVTVNLCQLTYAVAEFVEINFKVRLRGKNDGQLALVFGDELDAREDAGHKHFLNYRDDPYVMILVPQHRKIMNPWQSSWGLGDIARINGTKN